VITRKEIRNATPMPANDREGYSATEHFFVSSSSSNLDIKTPLSAPEERKGKNYG
jgi:hypothetical protein